MNKTQLMPEAAAGSTFTAEITDKRGFAARWHFSVRFLDSLISQGLPHVKVGQRRVRIVTVEGDRWMKERFGTQRRGSANRGRSALQEV